MKKNVTPCSIGGMSTSAWLRPLALVGALALGLLGSSFGAGGCLIPDYCIVVTTNGTDWCTRMDGALMWPIGQPELAEAVLADDDSSPTGCTCMNDGEAEILFSLAPAEDYAALVAEVESATRDACVALVPGGFEHNCLQYVDGLEILAPTFDSPAEGSPSSACIGSCSLVSDPPFGEPCDDPDPWECNDEEPPGGDETGGGNETGGGDETGTDTGFGPGPILDGRLAR